jgi:hypothetical protein
MPELTEAQRSELRRLREMCPFRIVYGAWNPQTGEYFAAAVTSMRIPNRLVREGWEVFTVERGR